jgi:hypothetical protein
MNGRHWINLVGLAVPAVHGSGLSNAGVCTGGHRKHPQDADNSQN